jgi:signal transduction histidine kinase
VFRIIQELINNSLKHSGADTISISFRQDANTYKLYYHDNGKGFDTNNFAYQKGLGLKNIESRISLLQAKLSINSGLNQGSEFIIQFLDK